jgi:fatty acid desaturase
MDKKRQKFVWKEFISGTLPLALLLFGKDQSCSWANFGYIIFIWHSIITLGSFMYSLIAVNAGHHGPDRVHEGDEIKSLDYGIYQISATMDRSEASSNLFMALTHFGDHLLHHLFPALDHALLPQFREVLFETCEEFNEKIVDCTIIQAVSNQFKQLGRTTIIKLESNKTD